MPTSKIMDMRNALSEQLPVDTLFVKLYELETSINKSTGNYSKLYKRLISVSCRGGSSTIYSLGIGVCSDTLNDSTGTAHLIKRQSAVRNSKKWACLIKKALNKNYSNPRSNSGGRIMYSETIYEKNRGDTTFLIQKIPLTSIVLW